MILVSYINARGEEIILDDTENTFNMGELFGREGTEAPSLKYTEILYGDGSTDIVVVNPMPREVTLYFWSRMTSSELRRGLETIKQKMIQTGVRNSNWGKLKIYVPDEGAYKYLNCVYTGGFDNMTRKYPSNVKFALTFRANDPLFYNGFATEYIIEPEAANGYLYLMPLTFTGGVYDFAQDNITSNPDGVYMLPLSFTGGSYDFTEDNVTDNPNGLYFRTAEVETTATLELLSQRIYPKITISGSGRNIRLINETTGKKIEFSASVVVDGDHPIVIETRPLYRKVVQRNLITGTETNLLSKLTSDSSLDFYIERGNNVIKYRNSEATPESIVTFEYTEGFLSAE